MTRPWQSEALRLRADLAETKGRWLTLCRLHHAAHNVMNWSTKENQLEWEADFPQSQNELSPVTPIVLEEIAKLVEQALEAVEDGDETMAETAVTVGEELLEQTVDRITRLEQQLGSETPLT